MSFLSQPILVVRANNLNNQNWDLAGMIDGDNMRSKSMQSVQWPKYRMLLNLFQFILILDYFETNLL